MMTFGLCGFRKGLERALDLACNIEKMKRIKNRKCSNGFCYRVLFGGGHRITEYRTTNV